MSEPLIASGEGRAVTPIAFYKTRSFWLGWGLALLTLADTIINMFTSGQGGPLAEAIVMVINAFGGNISAETVANFMLGIAPIYALVVGHQRRGLNQPYTSSPGKEEKVVAIIKQGTDAWQMGTQIGNAIKRK